LELLFTRRIEQRRDLFYKEILAVNFHRVRKKKARQCDKNKIIFTFKKAVVLFFSFLALPKMHVKFSLKNDPRINEKWRQK